MENFPLTAFRALRYNVAVVPRHHSVKEKFDPHFNWMDRLQFPEEVNPDAALRMAILLFDPGSPFKTMNTDMRAHYGAKYSYVDPDKMTKTYPDWVKRCVSMHDTTFKLLVIYYLSMIENTKVATLKALKVGQLHLSQKIMSGDTASGAVLSKIETDIRSREKGLITGYEVSAKFYLDIDAFLIDEDLDLSPEGMAKLREAHKAIFPEFDVYA